MAVENNFTDAKLERIRAAHALILAVRLPDGTVSGVGDLIFTRAIYMGLTEDSWSHRFCFEDRQRPFIELVGLQAVSDEPVGYVARR